MIKYDFPQNNFRVVIFDCKTLTGFVIEALYEIVKDKLAPCHNLALQGTILRANILLRFMLVEFLKSLSVLTTPLALFDSYGLVQFTVKYSINSFMKHWHQLGLIKVIRKLMTLSFSKL